jgi:hypothetical protein
MTSLEHLNDIDPGTIDATIAFNHEAKRRYDRQTVFLDAYAEAGTIRKAAKAAGVDRVTVYWWMKRDVLGFNERFEVHGRHAHREYLEDMVMDRLKDPQGNRGSDILLMAKNNAENPAKWRPNQQVADNTAKEIIAKLREMAAPKAEVIEGAKPKELP